MERYKNIAEKEIIPEMGLEVSANLAVALAKAVADRSEGRKPDRIDVEDILLGIATSEGNGSFILKAISGESFPQFINKLENDVAREQPLGTPGGKISTPQGSIEYSNSVKSLLKEAHKLAKGRPISTEHIVAAAGDSQNSYLINTLRKLDVGAPYPLMQQIKHMKKSIASPESPANIEDIIISPYEHRENPLVRPRERIEFTEAQVIDLVAQAEIGRFDDIVIRRQWVSELLNSLDTQKITVIVTDVEDEADAIVFGLARQLAKDADNYFQFQRIGWMEPGSLAKNPEIAINGGVTFSRDQVLYLPNLQRYLHEFPNILFPHLWTAIEANKLNVITTLTERQWNKVKDNPPFDRLRPVFPESPSIERTIEILNAKKAALEREVSSRGMQIKITPEAIKTAAEFGDRYYRYVLPPDGARVLLMRAANAIRIRMSKMEEIHDERVKADAQVDPEDIRLALEKLTGIEVTPDEPEKYLAMEEKLRERVVGQDEAIKAVSDAIRRAKAGLKDPGQPIGSFMFMGPSGVGKTELAKTLAEFLFDDERAIRVLDMSEYQERHTVARLVGAPPGYIGYDEGGQLTEAVYKKPYSVVVFDEIEKAHANVRNALLQIMEEGRLTDGQGKTVDFKNTVIIMTGNVGSEYFFLKEDEVEREAIVEAVQKKVKYTFRPEFLNRVDNILVFNSLKPEHLLMIVDIQMRKVNKKLAEQGLTLELDEETKKYIVDKGYQPEYGARPLKRVIRKKIEDILSKKILAGEFKSGDKIKATLEDGEIVFEKATKKPKKKKK